MALLKPLGRLDLCSRFQGAHPVPGGSPLGPQFLGSVYGFPAPAPQPLDIMQCLIRGRPGRGDHSGQLADHDLDLPPSRATQGGPQREAPTSVMVYLGGLGCMERNAQEVQARDEGCRTFPRPWRASEMIAHEEQGRLRTWVDQHGKWSAAPISPRFLGVGRGSFKYYIMLPIFNIFDGALLVIGDGFALHGSGARLAGGPSQNAVPGRRVMEGGPVA